ncbi:MAG: hypothetical protein KDK51_01715 [Deltaproteobacteria bacterium]|nr:hypothetical protein [Deltaproteobacteria bacterium]
MWGFILLTQTSLASIPQSPEKIDQDIILLWQQFNQALQGTPDQAIGVLDTLYAYQLDHKIDALPSISHALLGKLPTSERIQDLQKHQYWIYAKRFNPYSPHPYYVLCNKSSASNFIHNIPHCLRGLQLDLKTKQGRLFHYAYFSHILYSAIFFTIFFTLLCLFSNHLPFLCQYACSHMRWLSPIAAGSTVGLIYLTLTLTFGWVFGLMLCAWTLWNVASTIERFVLLGLFLAVGLLPQTFEAPAAYLHHTQTTPATFLTRAQKAMIFDSTQATKQSSTAIQHSKQSMYRQTFYTHNAVQLYIRLAFAICTLLLLGMFNYARDHKTVFSKRAWQQKRLILQDLHPYPILYFNFIRFLQKQDRFRKVVYFLFPPYYQYSHDRPGLGFMITVFLSICLSGLVHGLKIDGSLHGIWVTTWSMLLLLLLLPLWMTNKKDKNREIYAKNT